ncbi:Inositol-tetrakisphosphate 1-kinase [Balamuthia mandrillaris]
MSMEAGTTAVLPSDDVLPLIECLGDEVLMNVFLWLDVKSIGRASHVCQHWHNVLEDRYMWYLLYEQRWRDAQYMRSLRSKENRYSKEDFVSRHTFGQKRKYEQNNKEVEEAKPQQEQRCTNDNSRSSPPKKRKRRQRRKPEVKREARNEAPQHKWRSLQHHRAIPTEVMEADWKQLFHFRWLEEKMFFQTALDRLRDLHQVRVVEGLNDEEFDLLESRCKFCFPPDLRLFLSLGLPCGGGWPDWRHLCQSLPYLLRSSSSSAPSTSSSGASFASFSLAQNQSQESAPKEPLQYWLPSLLLAAVNNDVNIAKVGALYDPKVDRAARPLIPLFDVFFLPSYPSSVGNSVIWVCGTTFHFSATDLFDWLRKSLHRAPPTYHPFYCGWWHQPSGYRWPLLTLGRDAPERATKRFRSAGPYWDDYLKLNVTVEEWETLVEKLE